MEVEIRTDLPGKIKRERKRAASSEPHEAGLRTNGVASEAVRVQTQDETSVSASEPIVELEVLRIPPNPRLVICRYRACGEERRCMVNVGRNSKFVPGMKFRLLEPSDPTARCKPWPYAGRLPRRRGRW
jgi:hypothetical protein